MKEYTVQRLRGQARLGKKLFANKSDRELLYKICKEKNLLKLNTKGNLIEKKWNKDVTNILQRFTDSK